MHAQKQPFSTRWWQCLIMAGALASPMAMAGLEDPASASWGGWNRGDAGTIHHFWEDFVSNSFPNFVSDDTPNESFGPGTAIVSEFNGSITTSTLNAYNQGGIQDVEVLVDGNAEASPVRVALQLRTFTTVADPGSVALNGLAPDSILEIATDIGFVQVDFDGPGPMPPQAVPFDIVDTLYLWTLDSGAAAYAFSFLASDTGMSLDQLAVDVAPVPLPLPALLLGSGLAALAGLRRG